MSDDDQNITTIVHDGDCHPIEQKEAESLGVMTQCSLCGSPILIVDAFMKGVEYCQHGAPIKVAAMCPSCAVQMAIMDMMASGQTATTQIRVGMADDFEDFLRQVEQSEGKFISNKKKHIH